MVEITREEALRRWHSALRTKKEMTERMIKELMEDYERQHGEKPTVDLLNNKPNS